MKKLEEKALEYQETAFKDEKRFGTRYIEDKYNCITDFKEGAEYMKLVCEQKFRFIPVEEKEPPINVELICKIERLSWTDNKFAVGVFLENKVWMIDGRHISHYKNAVNNCVTHYREIN